MKKGDMKKDHVKKDGEDSNVKQEGNKQNNRPPFAGMRSKKNRRIIPKWPG